MRSHRVGVTAITVTAGTALAVITGVLVAACGSTGAPVTAVSSEAAPVQADPRGLLAGRVAVAKDQRYVAAYTLTVSGKAPRSILVSIATDRTWRVDIQGGALGGTADVAIAGRPEGQYQCPINPAAGCVKIAPAGKKLPAANDPRIQYVFVAWLDVLLDRQVPLSVAPADPLAGTSAPCFAVEPGVTAIQPPIDPGVFCYSDKGILTAAKLPFGQLALTGEVIGAPPTISLPGPVVDGAPLPTTAPPPPSPNPSGSQLPRSVSPSPSKGVA
ncbi:hypothetical protein GCM10010399_23930 [Dactylosporangium fulvum]|uniref:Uncharacterized protein n=1 Tax=Dactylosporangium fulvum TaxID=53359 RepID=A0ABY5VX76_9ACTN|nr:hypothetical protein [Dactylosporangium fulvum]UWP82293.1 hypothetical protein Dfulv_45760 [Dactylosporangium fulvum]